MHVRLVVSVVALLSATNCVTSGSALLSQDPLMRWVTGAVNEDARLLYRQNFATAQDDPASPSYSKTLAIGFDASDSACTGVDTDKIPNELVTWHNALAALEPTPAETTVWAEIPSNADSFEMSLIERSGGASLNLKPPAKVPVAMGAKFSSTATALTLARVTKRVDLSDLGRRCVAATLCRPAEGQSKHPAEVTFVERIYYGNLIRLRFSEQAFQLAGEGNIDGVTAKFSVDAKNVSIDGAILGRIRATGPGCDIDIPQILEHIAQKRLSAIQNKIAECAVNNEIIAIRFAKVSCSGS